MSGLRRLRVVIAGGGVAALETALGLRTLAPELTEIGRVTGGDVSNDRCGVGLIANRDLRDGRFNGEFGSVRSQRGQWPQVAHRPGCGAG